MEPEKPFACTFPDCSMTFTNEDHLHVHTKKHDMVLQLGIEQKAAFVADQTPTPTRFIRNCEEVGLFLDLQSVNENPFEEGFKRAIEAKSGLLSLENASTTEDVLHTPHLVFPLEHGDCAHYTSNNHRNITISRSSSDESGAVKEYETTTISKLTNEVTTISRVVGKPDTIDRVTTDDVSIVTLGEVARKTNETSVSVNNVIKIHSNVEIRKDSDKECKQKKQDVPPIMSQKSLDFVVDSLTQEEKPDGKSTKAMKLEEISDGDLEVIIKLPNGKHVKMKAVDDEKDKEKLQKVNAKERLKKVITSKRSPVQALPSVSNVPIIPITTGTLIPVTLVNNLLPPQKLPIPMLKSFETVKRKSVVQVDSDWGIQNNEHKISKNNNHKANKNTEPKVIKNNEHKVSKTKATESVCATSKADLSSKCAAAKRYRERLKTKMRRQCEENKHLKEMNQWLLAEKAVLKLIITNHMKKCPMAADLRNFQDKLQHKDQMLDKLQETE